MMTVSLIILGILSVIAGFIEWPHNIFHITLFSDLVQRILTETVLKAALPPEFVFQLIAVLVTLFGIYLGYQLYYRNKAVIEQWKQLPALVAVRNFLFEGWGFDEMYHIVFVRPFLYLT